MPRRSSTPLQDLIDRAKRSRVLPLPLFVLTDAELDALAQLVQSGKVILGGAGAATSETENLAQSGEKVS